MKTVIEVKEDGLAYVVNGQERILCADQAQAWTLAEPTGPGIYPIPGLEYEKGGRCCSPMPEHGIRHHGYCDECSRYMDIAILKESTLLETKNENMENIEVKFERGKESEITLYVRNLLATASNIIGVIEGHQWERLPSKTWDLKFAHDELKKRYDAIDQHRAAFDQAIEAGKGQEYIDNIIAKESTNHIPDVGKMVSPPTEQESQEDFAAAFLDWWQFHSWEIEYREQRGFTAREMVEEFKLTRKP